MLHIKPLWVSLPFWCIALWAQLVCAQAKPVQDQVANPLDAAELALGARDFGQAVQLARQAVDSGRLGPSEYIRAQKTLGIASGHANDMASATRAFTTLLAVSPDFRLSKDEPDEVRSPYLEARGFWAGHEARLTAKLERGQGNHVRVELNDPASTVNRVRVRGRVEGRSMFSEFLAPAAAEVDLVVPALTEAGALEYTLSMLDEHGNRIWSAGSEQSPLRLLPNVVATPTPLVAAKTTQSERPANSHPAVSRASISASNRRRRVLFLSLGSAGLALGAGAIGLGVRAHVEREDLAERWNRGACSGTGVTRAELCADERSRIRTLETVTTALYSGGGAALISGVVLLLVAPRSTRREAKHQDRAFVSCGNGPGWLGVSCAGSF